MFAALLANDVNQIRTAQLQIFILTELIELSEMDACHGNIPWFRSPAAPVEHPFQGGGSTAKMPGLRVSNWLSGNSLRARFRRKLRIHNQYFQILHVPDPGTTGG